MYSTNLKTTEVDPKYCPVKAGRLTTQVYINKRNELSMSYGVGVQSRTKRPHQKNKSTRTERLFQVGLYPSGVHNG